MIGKVEGEAYRKERFGYMYFVFLIGLLGFLCMMPTLEAFPSIFPSLASHSKSAFASNHQISALAKVVSVEKAKESTQSKHLENGLETGKEENYLSFSRISTSSSEKPYVVKVEPQNGTVT